MNRMFKDTPSLDSMLEVLHFLRSQPVPLHTSLVNTLTMLATHTREVSLCLYRVLCALSSEATFSTGALRHLTLGPWQTLHCCLLLYSSALHSVALQQCIAQCCSIAVHFIVLLYSGTLHSVALQRYTSQCCTIAVHFIVLFYSGTLHSVALQRYTIERCSIKLNYIEQLHVEMCSLF